MAGRWDRFTFEAAITTVGNHANQEVMSNASAPALHYERNLTVVDGIVTVVTDSDDLFGCRLIVAHELIVTGDISDTVPAEHDSAIYYSWFAARGPLVFRLRTNKTVRPEHKLWLTVWKELGAAASANIRFGMRYFVVDHDL